MSDGVLLGQLVVIWWKRWWRKDDDDCITVVARRYGNLISNSHRDSFRFLLRSFLFFAEFLLKFSFYFLHCQFHFFFPFFFFCCLFSTEFYRTILQQRKKKTERPLLLLLLRFDEKEGKLRFWKELRRSRRCFDALRQHLVSVWTCVQHKSRRALWRKRGDGQRRSTRQQTTFFFFLFCLCVYVDVMNSFFSLFYFFSSSFFVPISVGPI